CRLAIAVEAYQSMHEIGPTDDANHSAVAQDGKALDTAPFHELDHRLQRIVFADGAGIGGHDFGDFFAGDMHVFSGEPSGPEEKLEPLWSTALCADLAAAQKVAFRYDADELTCCVDDRETADAVLQHQVRRLENRFVGPDGNYVPRHDITNSHGHSPSGWRLPRNLADTTQLFRRFSAERLRSTIRREVGTSIAAVLSRHVNVRDTVSMVRPR